MPCGVRRYGYMEVVRQDDAFVRVVLERVLHLLYITLQDRASKMPLLHRELGLSDAHKVPVSFSSLSFQPEWKLAFLTVILK